MRNHFRDRHKPEVHNKDDDLSEYNKNPSQTTDSKITQQTVIEALRELTGHVIEKPKKQD